MGLKCRLLGHTYGDPEVERDREEQGDEVVVTIREVQVCERCGDEQIVSQNKEVTAIRSPDEVGLGDGSPDGDGAADADADADAQSETGRAAGGADSDGVDQPSVAPAESTAEPASAESDATAETGGASADPSGATESAQATDPGASEPAEERAETADASAESPGSAAETADGAGVIDEAEASGAGGGWETGSDDWEDVDADGDDAVILDDAETERDETQWPEETDTDPQRAARESAARERGAGGEPDPDEEVTNDAEIIDADEGGDASADAGAGAAAESADRSSGRERGEWAERDAGASDGWPDHDGEDEGYAATPGGDADVEFGGGGLTPEVNGHAEADAETVEGIAAGAEGAGARAEPAEPAADGEAVHDAEEGFARAGESAQLESDVPDDRVEFYCPNCGYARVAGASSMRAGDICPECKQGYIAERER